MECPSCHSETPDTSKFCISCGAALPARCPSCGSTNPAGAKFCLECGQKLAATPTKPATVSTASSPSRTEGTAERRQLTVMFCDLVGSTALSARLDPEDMREIIGAYHRCCAEQIAKAGGFVAKYMGDGVLAYFGYPQAHEDDAEQAVRSALALIEAVPNLRVRHDAALQVRVGVATGLVVVGDLIGEGAAQEQAVVGETPNLAARLQALAEPGQLVISNSTRRLTGGMFEYRDLGRVTLKGLGDPVQAWVVTGSSRIESRFEAHHETKLTPLVGREEELELLLHRWQRAKSGEGQVVLLSGEPGIGKSRLTVALEERIKSDPHTRVRYFCSPQHTDSALYPVISHLRRAARLAPDDTLEQRLAKVTSLLPPFAALAWFERENPPEQKLATLEALFRAPPSGHDEQTVALLADFMSVPTGGKHRLSELSPKRRKEKVLEALSMLFAVLAAQKPVLMVLEDAQWIDPTTLEALTSAVERVRQMAVLIVISARSEFVPPWPAHPHVTTLSLTRLSWDDATAVVKGVTGGKELPREVLEQILTRTDGVPLFLEELSKSVVESGALTEESGRYVLTGALSPRAIPSTLRASLVARLDRLPSARHVAQVAAVIGREFSDELVRAVTGLPGDDVRTALNQLVGAELVFRQGVPPNARYTFKHALVQEAVYETLLRGTRQEHHRRVVQVLEQQFPDVVTAEPERLAQHCVSAGFAQRGAEYWLIAARQSLARSAMAEAAAQFQKGLDQLALLPDTPERRRQELEFTSALGAALLAVKGQAAPETGRAYARAQELWEQLDCPSEFLQVPYGRSRYHAVRGELDVAQRLDEALLRLSRERNDPAMLVLGHMSLGRNLLSVGRFAQSRSHLEKALALYDPNSHRSLVHQVGFHPHVSSQAYLGVLLFCLGLPKQALAQSSRAIAEARRLAHPTSLAVSLTLGSLPLWLVGDNAALDERAEELIALATEHGFPLWRAQGSIFRGWVKLKGGDVPEGISLLRAGTSAYRGTGAVAWLPYYTDLLAAACEIACEIETGLTLLEDALQVVERTGERWFEVELTRHKGQLLLRQEHSEAAEELYRKALTIAKEQGGKWWELRASTSLARLWRDQGKRTEARELLAPIYGWFTEGFDTPDLKEAKALLEELS
jgi:class 3 adenylate cyclase/predicted ATPase